MPKKPRKVPSYCHHKPSGQAVVYIDREPLYLGPWNSDESHERYEHALARWRLSSNEESRGGYAAAIARHSNLTLSELLLAYLKHAQTYYVDASGELTKEYTEMRSALRPLRIVHGQTLVADFGPRALKEVRHHMVNGARLSRKVINRRINRIRRVFKWAVADELAPPGAYEALRAVEPLKQGRTTAHESAPVKPVPQEYVDPVVEAAHPQVAGMIQLQQLGAMRPYEVTMMRACDIDTTGDVWLYQPYHHKNRWRGKDRAPIFLGRRAQRIIRPFMETATGEYLFSPIDAENWRNARRKESRKSPMTPSQARRVAKPKPKRAKRERYDTASYRRAIQYTITRVNRVRQQRGEAEIPKWCPLQLRHRSATDIRSKFGIEAAQVFLGHEHADVTQVYAERDLEIGLRIARELG